MDKSKLNLELDEIISLPLPPLNYAKNTVISSKKISPENEEEIRKFFYSISENGKMDPQELRNKLRRIGK